MTHDNSYYRVSLASLVIFVVYSKLMNTTGVWEANQACRTWRAHGGPRAFLSRPHGWTYFGNG